MIDTVIIIPARELNSGIFNVVKLDKSTPSEVKHCSFAIKLEYIFESSTKFSVSVLFASG